MKIKVKVWDTHCFFDCRFVDSNYAHLIENFTTNDLFPIFSRNAVFYRFSFSKILNFYFLNLYLQIRFLCSYYCVGDICRHQAPQFSIANIVTVFFVASRCTAVGVAFFTYILGSDTFVTFKCCIFSEMCSHFFLYLSQYIFLELLNFTKVNNTSATMKSVAMLNLPTIIYFLVNK